MRRLYRRGSSCWWQALNLTAANVLHRRWFSTSLRVAPPICADEFRARRAHLLRSVATTINGHQNSPTHSHRPLVLIASQPQTFSAPDVPHVFRQCSNFRYLTGFVDTDSARLLIDSRQSVLFIDERTDVEILWNGPRTSDERIREISGIDVILPFSEFDRYLASVVRADTVLSTDIERLQRDSHLGEARLRDATKSLAAAIPNRIDLNIDIDAIRWRKSPSEWALMRDACRIGGAAVNATIATAAMTSKCSPANESEFVGRLEFEARRRGAQFLAYPPVIAAGNRANTIHYIAANQDINPMDCVLIDAGCDVDGYVSDITRCFPISGRFSSLQKTLYDALTRLQEDLLRYMVEVRPLRLNELYLHMLRRMGAILTEAHFFTRSDLTGDELMIECDKLCPHHVSHYLGMDVHDSPTVSRNIPLPSGVVITVEPGVYVQPENTAVRAEFHGIGMRVEDDILLTESGFENLTESCVRSSNNIEALMKTTP